MLELIFKQMRRLGPGLTRRLDSFALRWLDKTTSPYSSELRELSRRVDVPGVALLNLWQEWGCTSGISCRAGGPQLHRVFDWQMDGLGECLVALSRADQAGSSLSLTWPFFVGDFTVQCPGRFAIAMNQAPFQRRGAGVVAFPEWLDWLCDLGAVSVNRGMPPSHLLRQVACEAPSFEAAVRKLAHTPLCKGAIFIVAGVQENEAVVVERTPTASAIRRHSLYAGNHWFEPGWPGNGRPDSRERTAALNAVLESESFSLEGCLPPILNERTRYIASLNAQSGDVTVRRVEHMATFGQASSYRFTTAQQ